MQDTFAEDAKATGMTYLQYAHYRAKQARARCGIPTGKHPFRQVDKEPVRMLPPPKPEEQPQPPAAPSLATKNLPSLEEICNEISRLQEELRELRKTKKDKEQPHHRRKIWDLMNPGLEPKTMAAIIEEVCRKWGYTITDMRSARRDKRIVVARHELFWRCRHETYRSLSEIGRFLNKDHTTVLHGISRYEKLRNAIRDGTFDNEHGSGVLKDVKGLFL